MLPDFRKPAFAFVPLCALRFVRPEREEVRDRNQSDYRCQLQLHYTDDHEDVADVEVRVYFVGREKVNAGEDVSALRGFLDSDRQRERCREGSALELREGRRTTAAGIVHAIGTRRSAT